MTARISGRICRPFGVLLLVAAFYLLPLDARADERQQTWFDAPAHPSLEKSWTISSTQFNNSIKQGYHPTCIHETLLKNKYSAATPLWKQTITGCWYPTSLGMLMAHDNYLADAAWPIAGNIVNIGTPGGYGATLEPTPHDGTFLERRSSENTSKRYLKFHFGTARKTIYSMSGSSTHTIESKDTLTLASSSGHNAWPDGQGINYSRSGRWAVGTIRNYALFRINLDTRQILNFGAPIPQGHGWNPRMAVSISNDGRYAVATGTASSGNQWMRVYDLDDCDDSEYPHIAEQHANCAYRDLTGFLRDTIPNFNRFTMAEFSDENTLVFYHYTSGEPKTYTRYLMRAPNAGPRTRNYLALGDSYASGEGAHGYFRGTDMGKDLNNCHLSRYSYPYVIGDWLKLDSYHSVACSGARTRNVIGPEVTDASLVNPSRTNQYITDIDGNELGAWMPGYYPQIRFVRSENQNDPDTITISMIGNDIGFGNKVRRCLEPDTCYSSYEDRLEILREVYGKFDMLTNLYQDLKSTADTNAKIYVIGYPIIGKSDGNCGVNVRLNEDEVDFANQLVERLNHTIKQAADQTGVFYVDVEQALQGHNFCEETDSPAMNGLTLGDDAFIVLGNESYHPTANGHRLYAQTIIEKTDDFNVPMPAPNASIQAPDQEDNLAFLNKPSTSRDIMIINYDEDLANDVVYREELLDATHSSFRQAFAPRSTVNITLHSDPIQLGTAAADELGRVGTKVIIPKKVSTGFHTLHLIGKNLENKLVDIYKVIYVAHSPEDKNGDGLIDALQPCGVFTPSGLDNDVDDIDDACDGMISKVLRPESNNDDAKNGPSTPGGDIWEQPDQAGSFPNRTLTRKAVRGSQSTTGQDASNSSDTSGIKTTNTLGTTDRSSNQAIKDSIPQPSRLSNILAVSVILGLILTLLWRIRYARNR